jgi:hypothetical protein
VAGRAPGHCSNYKERDARPIRWLVIGVRTATLSHEPMRVASYRAMTADGFNARTERSSSAIGSSSRRWDRGRRRTLNLPRCPPATICFDKEGLVRGPEGDRAPLNQITMRASDSAARAASKRP